MSALGGNPDGICSLRAFPLLTDAVEKVGDGAPARNNRIASDDFLNRTCAFGSRLESILFRGPPQNPFSTASTPSGHSHGWPNSVAFTCGHASLACLRAAKKKGDAPKSPLSSNWQPSAVGRHKIDLKNRCWFGEWKPFAPASHGSCTHSKERMP